MASMAIIVDASVRPKHTVATIYMTNNSIKQACKLCISCLYFILFLFFFWFLLLSLVGWLQLDTPRYYYSVCRIAVLEFV